MNTTREEVEAYLQAAMLYGGTEAMLQGIRTMAETAALRFMAAGMDKETAAWDSFGKAVVSLDRKLKKSAAANG